MKKFSYDMMLTPYPIPLSIGSLRKPTLEEILRDIGYEQYQTYEAFLKLTPELFYTKMDGEEGLAIWKSFTELQKKEITLFNVIKSNADLLHDYIDLLNTFFEERVVFLEGYFVWLNKSFDAHKLDGENPELTKDAIVSVVGDSDMFMEVLQAIQQVCCCYDESDDVGKTKFKNAIAERLYRRMKADATRKRQKEEADKNYSLINVISAVSNNHPTISPLNVYQLTVFQLIDAFRRRQTNISFDMQSLSVSVWGDEKQKFNPNVWFFNDYDK